MKELTKEQRHEVYKLALIKYNDLLADCMCHALNLALLDLFPELPWYESKHSKGLIILPDDHELDPFEPENNSLPEYFKHHPEGLSGLWFPANDRTRRIEILTQCIEETK